jgi:hypothetical protein
MNLGNPGGMGGAVESSITTPEGQAAIKKIPCFAPMVLHCGGIFSGPWKVKGTGTYPSQFLRI